MQQKLFDYLMGIGSQLSCVCFRLFDENDPQLQTPFRSLKITLDRFSMAGRLIFYVTPTSVIQVDEKICTAQRTRDLFDFL